jgi:hypothetical protein
MMRKNNNTNNKVITAVLMNGLDQIIFLSILIKKLNGDLSLELGFHFC